LLAAVACALAGASSALADSNYSANWAGYAVHRSGVKFTKVSGSWTQPSANCPRGNKSYSASWVGLGGYAVGARALEQIGTEVDCTASGGVVSDAWYELVPAASRPIRMRVRPGDKLSASVSVSGNAVVVKLDDTTAHHSFQKTLHTSTIDVSSAEWIEEAPSECTTIDSCQTLPLADFGSVNFGSASAQATTGAHGSISNSNWGRTRITLVPGGRQYIVYHGVGIPAGAAMPSNLEDHGSAFRVRFSEVQLQGNAFERARVASGSGYLVHPGL
jgi:Peptidase A4 family